MLHSLKLWVWFAKNKCIRDQTLCAIDRTWRTQILRRAAIYTSNLERIFASAHSSYDHVRVHWAQLECCPCTVFLAPAGGWNSFPRAESAHEGVGVLVPENVGSFIQFKDGVVEIVAISEKL